MQECPHCHRGRIVKKGIGRLGDQRYLCRNCGRTFGTDDQRSHDEQTRRQTLHLWVEGLDCREIDRLIRISRSSVLKWSRQLGDPQRHREPAGGVEVIAGDELRTRVGQGRIPLKTGGLLIVGSRGPTAGKWIIIAPPTGKRS